MQRTRSIHHNICSSDARSASLRVLDVETMMYIVNPHDSIFILCGCLASPDEQTAFHDSHFAQRTSQLCNVFLIPVHAGKSFSSRGAVATAVTILQTRKHGLYLPTPDAGQINQMFNVLRPSISKFECANCSACRHGLVMTSQLSRQREHTHKFRYPPSSATSRLPSRARLMLTQLFDGDSHTQLTWSTGMPRMLTRP